MELESLLNWPESVLKISDSSKRDASLLNRLTRCKEFQGSNNNAECIIKIRLPPHKCRWRRVDRIMKGVCDSRSQYFISAAPALMPFPLS
jgi:hypothetical protein